MRKLTARTAVFFTLLCAIGCAGHKLNLTSVIDKADKIKLISMQVFEDYYNHQIYRIGQKYHINEIDREGVLKAKMELDKQADKVRDLLIEMQATEIALANTYDLWKATGNPSDQQKIDELVAQLMTLSSRISERMAEMRVE